jgi:hypothetical protein
LPVLQAWKFVRVHPHRLLLFLLLWSPSRDGTLKDFRHFLVGLIRFLIEMMGWITAQGRCHLSDCDSWSSAGVCFGYRNHSFTIVDDVDLAKVSSEWRGGNSQKCRWDE